MSFLFKDYNHHGKTSGYLVNLSLVGGHPLDGVLGQLLLSLLGVLLGDVGKRVIGLVISTIVVIPGSVQTLERGERQVDVKEGTCM